VRKARPDQDGAEVEIRLTAPFELLPDIEQTVKPTSETGDKVDGGASSISAGDAKKKASRDEHAKWSSANLLMEMREGRKLPPIAGVEVSTHGISITV
jgi:hypothetical protein